MTIYKIGISHSDYGVRVVEIEAEEKLKTFKTSDGSMLKKDNENIVKESIIKGFFNAFTSDKSKIEELSNEVVEKTLKRAEIEYLKAKKLFLNLSMTKQERIDKDSLTPKYQSYDVFAYEMKNSQLMNIQLELIGESGGIYTYKGFYNEVPVLLGGSKPNDNEVGESEPIRNILNKYFSIVLIVGNELILDVDDLKYEDD